MKTLLKSLILFVKKNAFASACFLLAVMVFFTGSVSYSKYISTSPVNSNSNAGSFICTAQVDGVSALSFTNTAFWGGTADEDRIAMNALRSIDFSVYNYDYTDENKIPSEVKLGYTLTFSAPQNFVEKLAFQLFDGENNPILPQVVLQDLIHAIEQEDSQYNTALSEDYNSTDIPDITFKVQQNSSGVFTATAGETLITLTPFVKQVQQTLNFRVWDCSALVDESNPIQLIEGGKLLAPLVVKYTDEVPCYKISVSMPQFKLDAGSPKVTNYSFKIAPTSVLEDEHLGGSFYNLDDTLITEIYGGKESDGVTQKEWKINSVHEQYVDTHYGNDNILYTSDDYVEEYGQNVMGSLKQYNITDPAESVETSHLKVTTQTNTTSASTLSPTYEVINSTYKECSTRDEFEDKYGVTFERYRVEGEGWNRKTIYTYSAPFSMQITKTTTETITETVETTTTTTETDVIDTIKTDAVDEDGRVITQTVTKQTVINQSTNTTTTVKTTTITTTETRTINNGTHECEYTVRWGNESKTGNTVTWTSKTGDTVTWNGGTVNEDQFDSAEEGTPTTVTSEAVSKPEISTTGPTRISESTEIIKRVITRSFKTNYIKIDEVSRKIGENVIKYTQDSKFNFLGTDRLQDYFLSQSYSKNYPFSVDVIFEQIIE